MIRLWQDPMDGMYICTYGEIEQVDDHFNDNLYNCNPTIWCLEINEVLSEEPLAPDSWAARELGAYNLIAQGKGVNELRLMMLLEQ